ncbi:glycoside hydrolase superfamily [Sordaria brevicollis]|uniref:Beta-xylanase n=1 Tax=Sordaria brevicollis TaxID=83679 RepID=A0AAE0PMC7_SORBR|nr:glycoside hydrolase superfamily [Sordaria brevicollis]
MARITAALLAGLLLSPLIHASPTSGKPLLASRQDENSEGLHSLMVAAGKLFFGTATDVRYLLDKAHQAIVNNPSEFGMIVPENSQKWGELEKEKGRVDFTNADAIAAAAAKNGQKFRCHVLTWAAQLPSFVTSSTWTKEALTAQLKAHITTVVTHYRSQCYSWDVVSEALSSSPDSNTLSNSSIFQKVIGPSYIPLSFYWASLADPDAKLYYNDFNLEISPLKAQGVVDIVHLVRNFISPTGEKGKARIDGTGLQSHLFVGQVPSLTSLISSLETFTNLTSLEVSFSELDISHDSVPANDTQMEQQAQDYMTVVSACLAVEKCVGITVWGFSDKYSWIQDAFPGKGEGCLYDEKMKKKAAWYGVREVLKRAGVVMAERNSTGSPEERIRNAARNGRLMEEVNGTALMLAAEKENETKNGGSNSFRGGLGWRAWPVVTGWGIWVVLSL